MKKLFLIALGTVLLSSLLFGCQTDEIKEVETNLIVEKTILIDTQDDLIKIDGYWLPNSNNDLNNWQNLQTIGWRLNEGFIWIYVDSSVYEIVDMELVNFPYVWYVSSVDPYSWYFEGPGIDEYIPNYSEIVTIKITLKTNN